MPDGRWGVRTFQCEEYGSVKLETVALSPADHRRLKRLQQKGVLTLSGTGTQVRVKFKAAVGVVLLDRYRLVVEPKIAFDGLELIRWIRYALDNDPPSHDLRREWSTAPTCFFDIMAKALIDECRLLLQTGLRRDYRQRNSVEPVMRGRLDFTRQVARRYGQVDRLHLRVFDRQARTWENQVCHAALRRVHQLAVDTNLARAAALLAGAFPPPDDPNGIAAALLTRKYTALNRRYRTAHNWAAMILNNDGIGDLLVDSGDAADAFIVDMIRLWELIVDRISEQAAIGLGGVLERAAGADRIRVEGDGTGRIYDPDVLLRIPVTGRQRIVLDAKYKDYASKIIGREDVHQLVTYASAYAAGGTPFAVLVYPQPDRGSLRELTVSGPDGVFSRIAVLGIDTSKAPDDAASQIAAVIAGRSIQQ